MMAAAVAALASPLTTNLTARFSDRPFTSVKDVSGDFAPTPLNYRSPSPSTTR
jgi:hypothetical protein